MKYLLIVFASLFFTPPFALALEIDIRRHVEVKGSATLKVNADYATWAITIRGEANSVVEATTRVENSSAKLNKALVDAGFKANIVRLNSMESGRHFEHDGSRRVFKGFYSQRSAVVTLNDLSKRHLLDKILLSDDHIEISSMQPRSSKHEENVEQSMLNAAAAAKKKAENLAKTFGAELGLVLSIKQANLGRDYSNAYSNRIVGIPSISAQSKLGQVIYRSAVTVKFALK